MLDVIRFILRCTTQFISMLFTIDLGNGINLGTLFCVLFIFMPLALFVLNFLKSMTINMTGHEILEDIYSSERDRSSRNTYQPKHAKKGYQPRHAKKGD